jgi:hypothetical protein
MKASASFGRRDTPRGRVSRCPPRRLPPVREPRARTIPRPSKRCGSTFCPWPTAATRTIGRRSRSRPQRSFARPRRRDEEARDRPWRRGPRSSPVLPSLALFRACPPAQGCPHAREARRRPERLPFPPRLRRRPPRPAPWRRFPCRGPPLLRRLAFLSRHSATASRRRRPPPRPLRGRPSRWPPPDQLVPGVLCLGRARPSFRRPS